VAFGKSGHAAGFKDRRKKKAPRREALCKSRKRGWRSRGS
jgi:hypothetical protein